MKNITIAIITIIFLSNGINAAFAVNEIEIISPDKQISVSVFVTTEGLLSYSVKSDGFKVLKTSSLGIKFDSIGFLKKETHATLIYDDKHINTSIERKEQALSPKDTLTIELIPGGGFVGRL
jgi:hypothetical protein